MQRRQFLRATVVVAGATLVKCGTDAKTTTTADAGATKDTATTTDVAADAAADVAAPAGPDLAFFPQSVCSGDPKADGAIVWARAFDAKAADKDIALQLVVATDKELKTVVQLDGKPAKAVTATAKHDGCAKVRLTALQPATLYWYQFATADGAHRSPIGRFKTAPAADADVAVKFAVCSCQDFNGKYYNSYARLVQEELDFFIHLGDYVYETTGNPEFQDITADRAVKLTDTAGAISFEIPGKPIFYAAKSLSNYRDLYKTYRGDKDLQKAHERLAMIAIWDDHEFADDCWQTTATYFDGAKDENDPVRRANADQAWFEYMPVDFPAGPEFEFDPKAAFPQSLRIYRDFAFGKHLHLVMTDLRRYRSDHLIPEDALPGAIMLDADALKQVVGQVPASATTYLDIDLHDGGKYAKFFKDHAADLKIAAKNVTGNVAVAWINARLKDLAKAADIVPAIDEAALATKPKGFSFQQMLKLSGFGSLGARYLVVRPIFEWYAKLRWDKTKGASENGMGDEQEAWFTTTMQGSKKTWKCWGNEYTFQRREVDLSAISSLPDAFKQSFLLSAEDWDGMPNRRDKLLKMLADIPGSVIVSGDIHAFFAGTPMADSDPTKQIVEFVGGGISSGTYQTLLARQAGSDPVLKAAGAESLAYSANILLQGLGGGPPVNPHLAHCHVEFNGFMTVQADSQFFAASYFQTDEATAKKPVAEDKLAAAFEVVQFRTAAGSRALQKKIGDAWKTWDSKKRDWV